MQVTENTNNTEKRGSAITVGNFDGIHLGHQAMLQTLVKVAKKQNLLSTVILFEPHPREYFLGEKAPARLYKREEKLTYLKNFGIDQVIVLTFDKQRVEQKAQAFIEDTLLKELSMQYLLVGQDFRFGHQREGDIHMLNDYAKKNMFELSVADEVTLEGKRVSSTWVREALASGNLSLAERLLNRPYSMQGEVVHGNQLGRKLGFPTANIEIDRVKSPMRGIFAAIVYGIDSQVYYGAASIGIRPAVGGKREILEVYILNFDADIYGVELKIEFLKKLRDEENYSDLTSLTTQIAKDVEATKAFFKEV